MWFYWMGAAVAYGIPVAAAVLFVRRPRLGARLLAGWVGLFGALALVVVGTTLSAVDHTSTSAKVRGGIAALLIVAVFATLATGLWRERRWALYTLTGFLALAALFNLGMSLRDHAGLETVTIVSYATILPSLLFMTYRAMRRASPAPVPEAA